MALFHALSWLLRPKSPHVPLPGQWRCHLDVGLGATSPASCTTYDISSAVESARLGTMTIMRSFFTFTTVHSGPWNGPTRERRSRLHRRGNPTRIPDSYGVFFFGTSDRDGNDRPHGTFRKSQNKLSFVLIINNRRNIIEQTARSFRTYPAGSCSPVTLTPSPGPRTVLHVKANGWDGNFQATHMLASS